RRKEAWESAHLLVARLDWLLDIDRTTIPWITVMEISASSVSWMYHLPRSQDSLAEFSWERPWGKRTGSASGRRFGTTYGRARRSRKTDVGCRMILCIQSP